MRIRTQLIISMTFFSVALLIISASVITTNQQVERLNTLEELAKNIELKANDLGYLSNDFLLYHERQQIDRWEAQYSSISTDISKMNVNRPDQQALLNNIKANQQRLKAVFSDVVSRIENTSQTQRDAFDPASIQISWSRLAVQTQGIVSDASRLSHNIRDEQDRLNITNYLLSSALLGTFGVFLLTNYFLIYRRTLKSISKLQTGTSIIGSGNLDFSIEEKEGDEFGELSHAFNRMTTQLKTVTASKADLEREITERKLAEEALRKSEQRWATTLASIGDAVIATDVSGKISFMNAEAETLTGWTLREASQRPVKEVFNIINEQTRLEVENPVTKVLETGLVVGLANHTVLVRKDGTTVAIDDSGAPIRDTDGKTTGVVLVFRDITERKQAEEEIKRHDAVLNAMNTIFREAITCETEEELGRTCLKVAEEITGSKFGFIDQLNAEGALDAIAISDPGWAACVIPKTKAPMLLKHIPVRGLFGKVMQEGRSLIANEPITHPDSVGIPEGHPPLTSYLGVPLKQDDRIIGVMSLANKEGGYNESDRDDIETLSKVIIETLMRKRAELALRKAHDELELRVQERTAELEESNESLQAEITERKRAEEQILEQATLLDKAQDAVAVRDLQHRIVYWNKGAEHMYGWNAKEVIGRSADDLLYKEASTPIEARRSIMEKGEWIGELHQVTKDGREIIVEGRWTLVRDDKGKPKSILIINTDVTERKKLEAQLLRAQRTESIGMLANGIAHDLNNILAPITISLELLREEVKDESEGQKTIDLIEKSAERGANLIRQIQSFALGVEGERKTLQVRNIISEVAHMVKETFPRNIEVRIDTTENRSTVVGDATQLHQVLMNLCVNARDAMPNGGTLTISAENFDIDETHARLNVEAKVGPYIVITIADTGTGIPSEVIDKIFDPFFTTKEFGKGTGLGLPIALSIVKSHGGFINLYSEVGKGSTFKIYLPAIKTSETQKSGEELGTLAGHGETILVVEDEATLCEITCSTLKKYGYKTVTANNGAEAITEYTENSGEIKIVLMDIMMPSMDGGTCIKVLREINPDVKIIAVSGLVQEGEHADIKRITHAFLQKPYTSKKLLTTIHATLNAG